MTHKLFINNFWEILLVATLCKSGRAEHVFKKSFEYWCACCWWSLTSSETICDKLRNHLWQARKPSLTSSETICNTCADYPWKMISTHRKSFAEKQGNTSPKCTESPCLSAFQMVRWWRNTSPETSPGPPPTTHKHPSPNTQHLTPRWWGVWWDVWWGVERTPHHPKPAVAKGFPLFWWGVEYMNMNFCCVCVGFL